MKTFHKNSIRIIGIDPGIEKVGIAVIEKNFLENPKETVVFSACFKTNKDLSQEERLALIYNNLSEVVEKYKPDIAGVEKLFFTTNQKTASVVSEARGVCLCVFGQVKIEVVSLSPTEVKQSITGNGNSKKEDIKKMLPLIIKIADKKYEDDETDAIAIALVCSSSLRYSQVE